MLEHCESDVHYDGAPSCAACGADPGDCLECMHCGAACCDACGCAHQYSDECGRCVHREVERDLYRELIAAE